MSNPFFFSLNKLNQTETSGGAIIHVTSDQVPGFDNLSFIGLKLKKDGFEAPIWHPNANKIGYCLKGQALVSIRSPTSVDTFTIDEGDVFFVPKGHIHLIANIGSDECTIKFACNHAKPETMFLSKALYSLNNEVFQSTFGMPTNFFEGLKREKNEELLAILPTKIKSAHSISSRYKFNIADSTKAVMTKGGYLQLATKTNLPVLDGLGILGFGLNPKGVVEPHWHTNAGELVYIVKGKTLITVLSPNGKIESMEVNGGEGAFAPASHFHNIQNIGNEDVEVIAFFGHAEPDYIGIGEVMGSYSNEILSATFNVTPDYFETFKKTQSPQVIVPV